MSGVNNYVLISRSSFTHRLFAGQKFCRGFAWQWMISRACWKPQKFDCFGKTIELERGQFVTSIRELSDVFGWSTGVTVRFLNRLKTETMIETQTDTGKTVVTICNYDKYQFQPDEGGTPSGTPSGTLAEHQRNTSGTLAEHKRIKENKGKKENKDNIIVSDETIGDQNLFGEENSEEKFPTQADVDRCVAGWNAFAKKYKIPQIRGLSDARKRVLKKRLIEIGSVEKLGKLIHSTAHMPHLMGENDRGWTMTFDWFFKKENFAKVEEGNYKNTSKSGGLLGAIDRLKEKIDEPEEGTFEPDFSVGGTLLIPND